MRRGDATNGPVSTFRTYIGNQPFDLFDRRNVSHAITTVTLSLDFTSLNPWNNHENFATYSTFAGFSTAVRLEGSLYLATDETYAVQVINIDTGCLMYTLTTPVFHDDPTTALEVRP